MLRIASRAHALSSELTVPARRMSRSQLARGWSDRLCRTGHPRARKNRSGFAKIHLSFLQKSCFTPLRPAPTRGRFAVVTDVGCGMRWALWGRSMVRRADERSPAHGEIAWSWPPGAEVKRVGVADERPAGDGGQDSRSPGRARIIRKAIAQGGPGVFGQTCGDCRLLFLLQAGHGRCAEYERQLGGGSPLSSLMTAKD